MGAPREEFLGGIEEWRVTATGTNAILLATKAGQAGQNHYVTGFSFSASGTIAASVTVDIRQDNGNTYRRTFIIPNAAVAPIIYEFRRALRIPEGLDCDITTQALGSGVTGRVELVGFTKPVS